MVASWGTVVLALAGIVAVTVLLATGSISADAGVPILSGLTLGGIGHANGYRQGMQADDGPPPRPPAG